jgi:hypothetical protein
MCDQWGVANPFPNAGCGLKFYMELKLVGVEKTKKQAILIEI